MGTALGAIASIVVGGAVATVTIIGLVSGSVNSGSDNPGDITSPTINYGSTSSAAGRPAHSRWWSR